MGILGPLWVGTNEELICWGRYPREVGMPEKGVGMPEKEVGMPEKGWVCQREVVGFPEAKVRVDMPGDRVWICIIR